MARRKEVTIEKNVVEALDDIISDRFGAYSKYIIQDRALPDARDGLKPVQRRILYSMYIDGNTAEKAHRKSAKAVGQIMGVFHPHGDSSIYDAMVHLSQDWKINLPLIDMHGNNGSIDNDPPAAMRYTEARLSSNAILLLDDIDKQCVSFTNNYDDTTLEPTVLPARYPELLVNGSTGISSGYATNIAPHNLNEIVEATIYRLNNPDCTLDDLLCIVKGPDFPTGGIVQGKEALKEAYATGKGKVVVRSKCEIIEGKTNNQIIITEIPYEVVKSDLVKKISDIYLNKKIEGISDVRDESGRSGLRIVVDLKKEANSEMILNYLYKNTDLQMNFSYNNIAIVNHRPTLLNLIDALDAFIDFRREVVLNRSIYLREKKATRLHIIDGLIKAISILDAIIETIRKAKDKKDAKEKLKENFLFSEEQAEAIVNLRLYRLTSTDISELKNEYSTLTKEINELESIIKSKAVLDSLVTRELKELNENNITPRRTVIEDEVQDIVIDKLAMVTNENCYIALSKDGYIKRFSQRAYDANAGSLPYTKDDDYLIGMKACETLDTLLVFTSKGSYICLPVYKIEEVKFKDLGKHLSTYVKMEGNEKIVGATIVKNFQTYALIVTATKNGMVKKTSLPRFEVSRTSKALTAMKLKNDDEMITAQLAYEGDEIVLVSKDGYYNKYSLEVLADLASKAQGVGGINVKNSSLCGIAINHHDGNELLLCSNKGGFKRIHFSDLPLTSRNAKGNRLFKQIKSNPHELIYVKEVSSYTSLIFDQNESIVLPVSEIPFMDTEATFSMPLNVDGAYSFIKDDLQDIKEADIIDLPSDYLNDDNDEYDQVNLFE